MNKSKGRALLLGATTGFILAVVGILVFGGRFALASATATPVAEGSARATLDFVASSGGLYLVVAVVAALAGAIIAGAAYAVGRELNSEAARLPFRYLVPVGILTAGAVGYGMLRLGLGLWSDITAGVVTIPVHWMLVTLVVAGIVTGAATAWVVDRLAIPEAIGFTGAAVPASRQALMKEMTAALATPLVGFVFAVAFAVWLSQILLEAAHIDVNIAVAIFSVAGTLILIAAVLLAYRPWERSDESAQTES